MCRINNMQVDYAYDIDVVMAMYSLIVYSDNYSKTSEILCQYCRDMPVLNAANDKLLVLMQIMLLLISLN